MDQVKLVFTDPHAGAVVMPLDFAVVHVPRPKHARSETNTPIYDELTDQFWPPILVRTHAGS